MSEKFVITEEWLKAHLTSFIGYNKQISYSITRDQAESLGISYPLKRGWIPELIGKEINFKQKQRFELHLKKKEAKRQPKLNPLQTEEHHPLFSDDELSSNVCNNLPPPLTDFPLFED